MKRSIYYCDIVLALNERLFYNSLAGVTEEQANDRISDHNNPIIWIAAHTVSARYNMLSFLDKPIKNPYNHLFENFRAYDKALEYPTLDEVKDEWQKVTGLLKEALSSVTDDYLDTASPLKSPIGDFSNGGTFAFLVQHESSDVGQLSILKKYYTRVAMTYN